AGTWRRVFWMTSSNSRLKSVLVVPESTIFASVWSVTWWSLGIGMAGMTTMVLTAWVIAARVTGPIPRLTAAAAAVEAVDCKVTGIRDIAVRNDEFGQLARGFYRMVDEVSNREGQLREAQDDLSRSERHYRALIEHAMDIISVVGRDSVVRYKSPSVRTILGFAPEELVGQSAVDFIHPEDRSRVTALMHDLAEHPGTGRPVEYRSRHKDGTWRVLEAKCTALFHDEAVGGIVVNSRDITERKQAEDEIRHLNSELDDRVRLRTVELEQALEELRAAKEAT